MSACRCEGQCASRKTSSAYSMWVSRVCWILMPASGTETCRWWWSPSRKRPNKVALSGHPWRKPTDGLCMSPWKPLIFIAKEQSVYKLWIAVNMLPCMPRRCNTCQMSGHWTLSYAASNLRSTKQRYNGSCACVCLSMTCCKTNGWWTVLMWDRYPACVCVRNCCCSVDSRPNQTLHLSNSALRRNYVKNTYVIYVTKV